MSVKPDRTRTWLSLATAGLLFVALLLLVRGQHPRVGPFTVTRDDGQSHVVTLPFYAEEDSVRTYTFEGHVQLRTGEPFVLNIIPDDCILSIHVDSVPVLLTHLPPKDLCNYRRGLTIDLSSYRTREEISLRIAVANSGSGRFGLTLQSGAALFKSYQLAIIGALGLLVLVQVVRACGLAWELNVLLCAGALIRFWYLAHTSFDVRSYDVLEGGGHLDYIKYIASTGTLPAPHQGWEFHQPPLYYLLGALVLNFSELFFIEGNYTALQVFSLICFMAFLVVGALTFSFYFKDRFICFALTALLCFWPSGIIHSVRIGNDVLHYALSAAGLYFAVRWWHEPTRRFFALAVGLSALALVTKSSGLALAFTITALTFLHPLQPLLSATKFYRVLACGGTFLAAAAVNFGDNVYFALKHDRSDWLLGNVGHSLNSALFVNRDLASFLVFDPLTYFQSPFTSTWMDYGGRQFFWVFLLKTALFAEFSFDSPLCIQIGKALGIFVLAIVALAMAGFALTSPTGLRSKLPLIISLIASLALLIAFSVRVPASPSGDFRFILPSLISICAGYGWCWEYFRKRRLRLSAAMCGLIAAAFSGGSVVFFFAL